MFHDKNGLLIPRRGMSLPLKIQSDATIEDIIETGGSRLMAFRGKLMPKGPYSLHYASGDLVDLVPTTLEPFRLDRYKDAILLQYARIHFYLLPLNDEDGNGKLQ